MIAFPTQMVSVESADPRMHRIAFFAIEDIEPMQELTYDYGYHKGAHTRMTECMHLVISTQEEWRARQKDVCVVPHAAGDNYIKAQVRDCDS
jgi:SET domain-containing protein